MCGIAGVYLRDGVADASMLAVMGATLRHRGPDDEGVFVDGPLGLAHQRLSIIDLSPRGHQPMSTDDGRFTIVYNGEIYNYVELRQRLLARGHKFASESDTEVLLRLYADEGPAAVRRLNGMFAFVIWDRDERTLFAARDHFGVKPLYYATTPRGFAFASEIKALLTSGLLSASLAPAGLADYLTFQFCLGTKTLFHGVEKLLPGHALLVRADGSVKTWAYWDLEFAVDAGRDEAYFEHQLLRLLEDSVRMQLRADVPVGAHLSGGLDSSTVATLAATLLESPIHTFTGGFREGPQYDETGYAQIVARQVGALHHEVFPSAADFVEVMPRLAYHMDEPAAGPGVFPQLFVSRLAREHVKVVLGGQGGDEIFGGYTRYLIAYLEACIKGGIDGTQEAHPYVVTFESILPNLPQLRGYEPLLRHFWQDGLFGDAATRYFRLVDRSAGVTDLVDPGWLEAGGYRPFDAYREVFEGGAPGSLINRMTRFDLKTLLPALLQVEDRTSMAVSLESRVPLLDHRIAELVAAMPPMIKFKGGRSKYIFRSVVRDVVPPEIHRRADKLGFPVPLTEWYRGGVVRDFVRETLLGERARRRGLFRMAAVEQAMASERAYGRVVWGLLNLELWMQVFVDGGYRGFAPAA
jgi:asparagine synthase (glutamine-hydrolysing)